MCAIKLAGSKLCGSHRNSPAAELFLNIPWTLQILNTRAACLMALLYISTKRTKSTEDKSNLMWAKPTAGAVWPL